MQRICTTLSKNGYFITLIGRKKTSSLPLSNKPYAQKRLNCWFQRGKLFYLEYNFRLLMYLLFKRLDAICAIDLDTIVPAYIISKFKRIHRVYDAHELFTEQKEVITRPFVYKLWKKVEKRMVPAFANGYTVCDSIAEDFKRKYNVTYQTIRNLPVESTSAPVEKNNKFILYQGAVNEGRGFEYLVPAMQKVNYPLVICGDGNFMSQVKELISKYQLDNNIVLKGMLKPEELAVLSRQAFVGINLVENVGLNQYYSLANKFFDYIHAGLPQVTMNFPEYKKINDQYKIAVLIDELTPEVIAAAINKLANDAVLYDELCINCENAMAELNWDLEQMKLITFYNTLFS
ncbi:MAG: glycosyltransferase [Chitinophagaceae bacterium]|nr:glycosyltransferase [Chitinophagaceae bacterium]